MQENFPFLEIPPKKHGFGKTLGSFRNFRTHQRGYTPTSAPQRTQAGGPPPPHPPNFIFMLREIFYKMR